MTHLLTLGRLLLRRALCLHRTATRRPHYVHPTTQGRMDLCACGDCGAVWLEYGK